MEGAHPAIMKKLMETNLEKTVGYGQDPYTEAVSYTHLDVYKRQEEKRADQENDTEEQSTEAKSLLKKKLQYYSGEIQRDVGNLVKWLMIAVLVGCITGAASTLFSFVLKSVTNYRKENEWMFYLLPVMGLIIVFLYEKFGKDDGGTNQVLSLIHIF